MYYTFPFDLIRSPIPAPRQNSIGIYRYADRSLLFISGNKRQGTRKSKTRKEEKTIEGCVRELTTMGQHSSIFLGSF